ncbi:Acetylcholine receptor subunit alpha-like 2 [Halotydeus destructor]|nr:Acetylcholine receptor subunit alpha-like 2 [Halotydeus destructor]
MTSAVIHYDGRVVWNPPAIYKSSCQIDVQYFPFDRQECFMKFGSWSYDGNQVDLKHISEINGTNIVPVGIDLSEFYLSVEWDIMAVPAMRREKFYSCCIEPYPDIVSLTISILLSLTFYFLVLIEIIPSTSLSMPLMGKYLVFTLVLVSFSVIVTIAVLNVHFRSPSTHRMAPWVRKLFIHTLPKMLLMPSPQYRRDDSSKNNNDEQAATMMWNERVENGYRDNVLACGITEHHHHAHHSKKEIHLSNPAHEHQQQRATASSQSPLETEQILIAEFDSSPDVDLPPVLDISEPSRSYPVEVDKAIKNAMFIAQHIDNADEFESIKEDWKYVAMVLDRFFLWIFAAACIIGTGSILLQAPSLYDFTQPIDVIYSKVAKSQFEYLADPSDIE